MLGRIRALLNDFTRVWRRDGFKVAAISTFRYVNQYPNVLLFGSENYQNRRIDNSKRWAMIEARISSGATNALDIGCNAGTITRSAAESGLFSIGIDRKHNIIANARRKTSNPNCHFIQHEIGPSDVKRFPNFDVTLLLTVYYHWGNAYGWDNAEDMLRNLVENTNQLFIETPNSLEYISSEKFSIKDTPRESIHAYFSGLFPRANVEFVGETSYNSGKRTDLIFEVSS